MISNDKLCKVFQITYELKFTAETDGISVSPDVYIPITIGSVGLQSGSEFADQPFTTNERPFGLRKSTQKQFGKFLNSFQFQLHHSTKWSKALNENPVVTCLFK